MFDLSNLPNEEFGPLMPSRLVLGSHQGTGKTVALSLLPKCLNLDLESGTEGYGGFNFDLRKKMNEYNMKLPTGQEPLTLLGTFRMFVSSLKEANAKKGDYVYDFLGVDTLTQLQKLAEIRATSNFNKSIIGQGMIKKGSPPVADVISELPEGAGYRWLYMAWDELYQELKGLVRYGIIFLGHTKQGSLLKNGTSVAAKDLDLTGKLKTDLLRDCQAAGYLYRKDANTVMFNNVAQETDLMTKNRAQHLMNAEFVFSKFDPTTKELTVFWNLIYPDWVKEPIVKKIA